MKKEYADNLREADAIFIEELHKADWYHKTSQAFAVFLTVKSVGVVGDSRRYEWVIALRAVVTIDFMTARWALLPYATNYWKPFQTHHQRAQRRLPRHLRREHQAPRDD